jgi:hypothetical protein
MATRKKTTRRPKRDQIGEIEQLRADLRQERFWVNYFKRAWHAEFIARHNLLSDLEASTDPRKVVADHFGKVGRGRGGRYHNLAILRFYAELSDQHPDRDFGAGRSPVLPPRIDILSLTSADGEETNVEVEAYLAPFSKLDAIKIVCREIKSPSPMQCRKWLMQCRDRARKQADQGSLPSEDAWITELEFPTAAEVKSADRKAAPAVRVPIGVGVLPLQHRTEDSQN